jgi:isopentenyl phosphate kinase
MFIHTINIAHLPLVPNEVTQVLDEIVNVIRFNQKWRAMKVIHGNGGMSHTTALKIVVRNWADRNRKYFKGIIPGERYNQLNPTFLEMQKVCGSFADPDLGVDNSGVPLICMK